MLLVHGLLLAIGLGIGFCVKLSYKLRTAVRFYETVLDYRVKYFKVKLDIHKTPSVGKARIVMEMLNYIDLELQVKKELENISNE